MKKRILSIFIAICILCTMVPFAAFAEDAPRSGSISDTMSWSLGNDGKLTISGSGRMPDYYYDIPWLERSLEIKQVVIGPEVENIGYSAFYYCTNLNSVDLGSVTEIGQYAFYGCALTDVEIPDTVETVSSYAFASCKSLKNAVVGNSTEIIYPAAFSNCVNLETVTLGSSLRQLGDNVFYNCGSLYEIRYVGTQEGWDAVNKGKNDDIFDNIEVIFVQPKPDAPSVTASNASSTGYCTLKWDEVDGAAKYEVYRATSKTGSYSKMSTTSKTSYTNTSAKAGKTYYYKVRAVSTDGTKSDFSSVVSRTCDCAKPVVTLSNVASSGKIKLTWSAVTGATKYEVYRATSKTGTYTKLTTTTKTSYTNTSAKAGKTYYYKVKAKASTSAADSAYSTVVSRTCDLARPTVKIALSSGDPKLSWAKIDSATKYEVYRATSKSGTYTKLTTTTKTSYVNTSAKAGKTYYYKVKAVCGTSAAASAYSSIVSIKAK